MYFILSCRSRAVVVLEEEEDASLVKRSAKAGELQTKLKRLKGSKQNINKKRMYVHIHTGNDLRFGDFHISQIKVQLIS